MATEQVKWTMEADYVDSCNCDIGCPCLFQGPPTKGFCDLIVTWRINRGSYGAVPLDGLAFAFVAHWPEEMWKGKATAIYFIDQRANPKQREALTNITTGQAGGIPFELFAKYVFTKMLDPQYVPFEFSGTGKDTSIKIGDAVSVALEAIKNPASGKPDEVHVERPAGILFTRVEMAATKENRSNVPGLTFSNLNRSAAMAQVKYGN